LQWRFLLTGCKKRVKAGIVKRGNASPFYYFFDFSSYKGPKILALSLCINASLLISSIAFKFLLTRYKYSITLKVIFGKIKEATHMSGRVLIGFILVILGVAFLLNELQIIQFAELIKTYWPLIIAFIGLQNLVKKPNKPQTGLILILIAAFLQLKKLDMLPDNIWEYFWPALLIIIGLAIIFSRNSNSKVPIYNDDRTNYVALFSGLTARNNSRNYMGGSICALFGGVDIDLSNAEIAAKEADMDLSAVFGGITIKVPEHWKVIVKGIPLFGGWENKTKLKVVDEGKDIPVLKVYCFALFGGIEIKN